jgi:MFS family permease
MDKSARRAPSPLADPAFRMLWLAWLTGNMSMWMHDVTASWNMSQLSNSPTMVALVQAAASLPLFLLGLPSGALADRLNRRHFYAFAQAWVAVVAVALAVMSATDTLSAPWLLLLSLANGIGLALRFPVFSALVADTASREQLPAALTLNALAINLTRIAGPLLAGLLMASLGTAVVFALNAVMSTVACLMILRAPLRPVPVRGPHAHLWESMAAGLRFARGSRTMQAILLRVFVFFVQSVGLIALLPLVARQLDPSAATYTTMLTAMGAGAVAAGLALPRLPGLAKRDRVVDVGVLLYSAATVAAALAPNPWLLAIALAVSGAVWLCAVNTMTMSAQLVLPEPLRARGMAIYQMAVMGGSAGGAALWGKVASLTSVGTSLLLSAGLAVILLLLTRRVTLEADEAHTPSAHAVPATAEA